MEKQRVSRDSEEFLQNARRISRSSMSRLEAEDVARIKRRLLDGETATAVAADYGVSLASISRIRGGSRWAEIEPENG